MEYVITDGTDSSLEVTTVIDPPGACISADSDFQLVKGVGVFRGSICAPGENIRLRFITMTSDNTTLSTPWTPYFDVTGKMDAMYVCTWFECVLFILNVYFYRRTSFS